MTFMSLMNGPITQIDVENNIRRLCEELETETESYLDLMEDEARKSAKYKHGWAGEYIRQQGPVSQREAYADYKMEAEHFDWKVAEAIAKAKKEKLSSLRTMIEAYRTLNANVRALVN